MNRSSCRGLAATAAAVLAAGLLSASPAQAADDVTINLVATNDFHGQIDDNLVQWAATVEQVMADGPSGNSLFLAAGDNVGESTPASSAQNDDPTIDVLNLLGLDASAVGNHEFDKGYSDLTDHLEARSDFPILGANVKKADGSPALDASTMFTVGGLRVAVIGAVTEDTPNLTPPEGIEGLSFGDPVTAINDEVDRLNALPDSEKPQVIVATIHEGAPWGTWALDQAMQESSVFTRIVNDISPDVDAIITGHTHNTYVYNAPMPGDSSRTRPIIQTGFHGSNVGQIKLTVDADTGDVKAYTARNVARVTTSDAELTANDATLAKIATLRDDAVAFADQRAEEAAETKVEYDDALAARDDAYAKAETAKDDYNAAATASQAANATAASIKQDYDAAAADGKEAYDKAATVKQAYDAAVATGKDAYAAAATVLQAYNAAASAGTAAYTQAAAVVQAYNAAASAGTAAYTAAAAVRDRYLAAMATGKDAYAAAADVSTKYLAAVAAGKDAYATAANLRDQYLAAMATRDADTDTVLANLAQQYQDALTAGNAAYAQAADLKDEYDADIAAGKDAYAQAASMKDEYNADIAAGKDAYAQAASMKDEYNADIAAGKDAYAQAAGMKDEYNADIAAGKDAYAQAASMKDEYNADIAAGNAAYAKVAELTPTYQAAVTAADDANAKTLELKDVCDAAVAVLNAALETVKELADKLLSLGGIL